MAATESSRPTRYYTDLPAQQSRPWGGKGHAEAYLWLQVDESGPEPFTFGVTGSRERIVRDAAKLSIARYAGVDRLFWRNRVRLTAPDGVRDRILQSAGWTSLRELSDRLDVEVPRQVKIKGTDVMTVAINRGEVPIYLAPTQADGRESIVWTERAEVVAAGLRLLHAHFVPEQRVEMPRSGAI